MKLGGFLEDVSDPPDPQLEQLFAAARHVAEPSAEHRQRVSAALRVALPDALAIGAPSSAVGEAARVGSDLTARASASSSTGEGLRALLSVRGAGHWLLLGALLIGGAGFGLGHWVGAHAEAPATPAGVPPEARDVLARGSAPGASAVASPLRSEPSVSDADASRAGSAPIARGDEDARGQPRSSVPASLPAPEVRRRSQRGSSVAFTTSPERASPAQRSPSFREILAQLRRAREHLANGHFTLTLLMLSELDRSAGELLWEERETTRILALCASGEDSAARLAASALQARTPGSIYAMRLSESCAGPAVARPRE
jgi:hypothetical protein